MNALWSAVLHFFGVEPRSPSTAYNWWSGAGSDIAEVTIIGVVIERWHHVNCHVTGCLRIGHFPVEGTPFKVCRLHHPNIPSHGDITAEHIHAEARHAEGER